LPLLLLPLESDENLLATAGFWLNKYLLCLEERKGMVLTP
jgi:hypothetical protein